MVQRDRFTLQEEITLRVIADAGDVKQFLAGRHTAHGHFVAGEGARLV